MSRTFALAEIKPCPSGWDPDRCYDDGRGLNPCGTDRQHCQGNGTSVELLRPPAQERDIFDMLDMIECNCDLDRTWTAFAQHGDPFNGAGVSVHVCDQCVILKTSVIAWAYGTCTTVDR